MAVFRVKAGTIDGKVLEREFSASSRDELMSRLETEGLFPITVKNKGFSLPSLKPGEGGRVKPGEFLVFNYGFSTLLKAGLPVLDSLEALKKSSRNPKLSRSIEETINEIKTGKTLSEAMRRSPGVFPELFTASIAAGERTGDLLPAIKGYIEFQKKVEAIRKKIVSATVYPAVLAGASILIVAFLMTYVVPSFAKIYLDSGAELPLPTRILLGAASVIKSNLLYALAVIIPAIFILRGMYRQGRGRRLVDSLKLTLPGFGEIYMGYSIAKFSRTFGMVLKSGVPVLQGLEMSKGVLDNSILEGKLQSVIKKTREGESVSEAIREQDLFPEITYRMFSVGEKSASLPVILDEIADFHEQDVTHRVGILTDLLEPALMIIMGLVIGTIVVLMYLPIFQLGARV